MRGERHFTGDVADITRIVLPFATGPTWLKYHELQCQGSDNQNLHATPRLRTKVILSKKEMIVQLRALQKNLAFPQETLKAALLDVLAQVTWTLPSDTEKEQWAAMMASRILCMCCHCNEGLRRKPHSPWVKELLATVASPAPPTTAAAADLHTTTGKHAAAADDCSEGVDPETGRAFRINASGQRELAIRLFCQEGAQLTDPVWAIWPDGTTRPFNALTTGGYVDSMTRRRRRVLAPPLWRGTHKATGTKLEVVVRKQRGPLFCLLQNGQEICEVSAKKLNDDWQASEDLIRILAEKFSQDRVAQDHLYQLRDRLVTQALKAPPKKRPAACRSDLPPSPQCFSEMIDVEEHEDAEEEEKVHDAEESPDEEELAEEKRSEDEVRKKPAAAERAPQAMHALRSSRVERRSGKMATEAAKKQVTKVSPEQGLSHPSSCPRPKAKATAWVQAFMGQGPGMSLDEEIRDTCRQ